MIMAAQPVPTEPPARNLLVGKHVVITAAAGTGIGFATAKRCVEEGATVVISDLHERRLGEAADAIAEATGFRPGNRSTGCARNEGSAPGLEVCEPRSAHLRCGANRRPGGAAPKRPARPGRPAMRFGQTMC